MDDPQDLYYVLNQITVFIFFLGGPLNEVHACFPIFLLTSNSLS